MAEPLSTETGQTQEISIHDQITSKNAKWGILQPDRLDYKSKKVLIFHIIDVVFCIAILIIMFEFKASFNDLEFPGCCGLVTGNTFNTDYGQIEGSPSLCSMDSIKSHKYGDLQFVFDIDNNDTINYFCGVQSNDIEYNFTKCTIYQQGNIETCMDLGGYSLSDICSEEAIKTASDKWLYSKLEAWLISTIVITFCSLTYSISVIIAILSGIEYLDLCSCCVYLLNFVFFAFHGVMIVYLSVTVNMDEWEYTNGPISNNAEEYFMGNCSKNNYPIILDVKEYDSNIFPILSLLFLSFSIINNGLMCWYSVQLKN